jgi:hypothetical protein
VTFSRHVGSPRPRPVPPTPAQPTGGQRFPRLPLAPLGWLRAHGYLVTSLAQVTPAAVYKTGKQAAPVRGAMTGAAHTHRGPVTR